MEDRRAKCGKRRQNKDMPSVPFKDCNWTTVTVCRRKTPDRRINNIQVEQIDDVVTK